MISRRRLLAASGLVTVSAAVWPGGALFAGSSAAGRRIALTNLHSGEQLEIEYFRENDYLPDALTALENLLRDLRNGEKHGIDPRLMDYLVAVAGQIGVPPAYSVISGYRSPQSHERLHGHSSGVSQRSLHVQGRAIDVRMSGVNCQDLAASAKDLKQGGVGYYRASDFVHLDTGAFRTWRG
jgi:uncharacterized protein YcbK (DUF882 family)